MLVNGSFTTLDVDADALFDGDRHSLALTWDQAGGSWEIFLDGVSQGTQTGAASGQLLASGGQLYLGMDMDSGNDTYQPANWGMFQGTLYDVRIFDTVRSGAEIAASHQSSLPYDEPNLVANWQFNSLSTDGVITDTVSGNNLTVDHVAGGGFSASTPELTFSLDENTVDGTIVGSVSGVDAEREAQIASLLAADPDLRYSPETGKFYKLTSTTAVDWAGAGSAASSETLGGVTSQLVNIRSAHENSLVTEFADVSGATHVWLGATDETVEGEWRWQDDSSLFWQGDENGYAVDQSFVNWGSNQPNGVGVGDYGYVIVATGEWWDHTSADTASVLVEWNADEVLDATQAITYSIQSQSVAGAFEIDADTGEIRVADGTLLDADTLATHTVTVRVTDTATPTANTYDEDFHDQPE